MGGSEDIVDDPPAASRTVACAVAAVAPAAEASAGGAADLDEPEAPAGAAAPCLSSFSPPQFVVSSFPAEAFPPFSPAQVRDSSPDSAARVPDAAPEAAGSSSPAQQDESPSLLSSAPAPPHSQLDEVSSSAAGAACPPEACDGTIFVSSQFATCPAMARRAQDAALLSTTSVSTSADCTRSFFWASLFTNAVIWCADSAARYMFLAAGWTIIRLCSLSISPLSVAALKFHSHFWFSSS
mmetsp:Transcript_27975/g.70787  ORF Transcript_27975/g.70787 Transcript_27975/m.70787 type:complete len:239 (+) Transcript_27975:172-888(+)